MKSQYFEITIGGQSFTASTLLKALEALRGEYIPTILKTSKRFQFVIDDGSFKNFNGSPGVVGESVERITDREYKRLQDEKRKRRMNRNLKKSK